jgi:hypothetical protein
MDREAVNSSSLVSLGYDASTETLEVEFNGGRIYQYYNIPLNMYETLKEQASVGTFFNANIRNNFPNTRM